MSVASWPACTQVSQGLGLLLANYLVSSLLTGPRILPNMCVQLFTEMDPTSEAYGCMSTYYGVVPPPFLTPKEPSCTCADREVLDFRSRHLICTLLELSFCHLHCPWSVWLKTNFEFYSIWQIPGAQPSVPSISNLMFTFGSSCDGEFKKSSDRVTLAHCWIPISCTQ